MKRLTVVLTTVFVMAGGVAQAAPPKQGTGGAAGKAWSTGGALAMPAGVPNSAWKLLEAQRLLEAQPSGGA